MKWGSDLTCSQALGKEIWVLTKGTMQFKQKLHLPSTHKKQKTAQILQKDIFWFFLNDESFVSKTLNGGHVELSKFPASTVRQFAKKMESSQATAKHMKQVTRDPQAVQVNLLWHQCTEIPPSKSNKKRKTFKLKQEANKYSDTRKSQENRRYDPEHTRQDRCSKCGDSWHREGFRCPASKHQCSICKKIGHFSSLYYKKKDKYNHKKTYGPPKVHQVKIRSVHTQDALRPVMLLKWRRFILLAVEGAIK